MPVGCLGGGSASNNGGLAKPMDVIVTSTVLNAADQFAFMQQTLLMQIFRLNHSQVSLTTDSSGSNNGANGNGCSQMPSILAQKCPTCIAFSDRCCQEDNVYHHVASM